MRSLRLDKDKRLSLPESEVARTCIEWLQLTWPGAQYIRTDASDRRRNGAPSHPVYTLDGLFVHTSKQPVFIEWKRRLARTQTARRRGQRSTAQWLIDANYCVILMLDQHPDPIGFFKNEMLCMWSDNPELEP